MSSVFLSHNHADKTFANRLARDLRGHGHVVWVDEEQIQVGDSLIEKIRNAIDRVNYVIAVISSASINSEWVRRELDIACNREIEQKKVIVIPALLEDVALPGFLKGKLFADFRITGRYDKSLAQILSRLGPGLEPPELSLDERIRLENELVGLQREIVRNRRDQRRFVRLSRLARSDKLRRAIEEDNAGHPELTAINEMYAFEALGIPVTLGYALHAIRKAEYKGAHPLDLALRLDNKWDHLELMIEAYRDFLGLRVNEDNEPDESNDD